MKDAIGNLLGNKNKAEAEDKPMKGLGIEHTGTVSYSASGNVENTGMVDYSTGTVGYSASGTVDYSGGGVSGMADYKLGGTVDYLGPKE